MTQYAYCYIAAPSDRKEFDTLKATIREYYDQNLRARYGWAGIYVDSCGDCETKAFFDRPVADVLCVRVQRNDAVILPDLSSSFRGPGDRARVLEFFRSRRAAVHFVREGISTTDPEFADMLSIAIDSVRKADDEYRRQAILAKMDELRRRGQPMNNERPIGARWIGPNGQRRLVPHLEERATMERIFTLHQQGLSFAEIREHLLNNGVSYDRAGQKRPWSESRCRRAYRAWMILQEEEVAETPVASEDLADVETVVA